MVRRTEQHVASGAAALVVSARHAGGMPCLRQPVRPAAALQLSGLTGQPGARRRLGVGEARSSVPCSSLQPGARRRLGVGGAHLGYDWHAAFDMLKDPGSVLLCTWLPVSVLLRLDWGGCGSVPVRTWWLGSVRLLFSLAGLSHVNDGRTGVGSIVQVSVRKAKHDDMSCPIVTERPWGVGGGPLGARSCHPGRAGAARDAAAARVPRHVCCPQMADCLRQPTNRHVCKGYGSTDVITSTCNATLRLWCCSRGVVSAAVDTAPAKGVWTLGWSTAVWTSVVVLLPQHVHFHTACLLVGGAVHVQPADLLLCILRVGSPISSTRAAYNLHTALHLL